MALHSRMVSIERNQHEFTNEFRQFKSDVKHELHTINRNVGRILVQPVARAVRNEDTQQDTQQSTQQSTRPPFVASLIRCPRDLYTLWQEYEFGIGGRKPARQFTPQERGKVKVQYSRRKCAWNVIERLIRSGYTAQTACDKIYEVYGHVSICKIIDRLRADAKTGGNPALA